jgi:hypothetical protein
MLLSIIKSPLAIFFYLSVILTQTSVLFPQNIGSYQKVAGWPLTMYKVEYKRVGDIKATGEIIHQLVKDNSTLMLERVLLNIALWTILFYIVWFSYQKFNRVKSKES